MSTKLYAGLRLIDPDISLFDVVAQVSTAVKNTFTREADQIVAQEVAMFVDDFSDEPTNVFSLFSAAEQRWLTKQQSLGRHSTFNDPLRFSIVFGRTPSGRVLAYPFYSGDTYAKALTGTGLFEDYHYQNQSDRPDCIDDAEWSQRSDDWDAVLDKDGTFADLPMWELAGSIDDVFNYLDRSDLDVNEHVTADERLHRILSNAVAAELIGIEQLSFSAVNAAHKASSAFLASDRGSQVPRPKPVPSLATRADDLEPRHRIHPDVLSLVVARAKQILDHGTTP